MAGLSYPTTISPLSMNWGAAAPSNGFLTGLPTPGLQAPQLAFPTAAPAPAAGPAGIAPVNLTGLTDVAASPDAQGGIWNWFGNNSTKLTDLAGLLGGAAQIWGGFQANKAVKDQLNFAKTSFNTNLVNQTKSYNTALEDRIRARASSTGMSQADAESYIAANKL